MTQSQRTLVEGKVAKILNDRELVINKGTKDSLQLGDKFKILEKTDEIFDPDTKVSLGSIERVVVRVKVVHVEPLMSITQTYETYTRQSGQLFAGILPGVPREVVDVKTLRRPGSVVAEDYMVKIGDIAAQINEE
ncbi:MAG: hypothetical protein IH861_12400 [Chloroflexi bacterium]|nr:hypothetical protein [Chloroflexota bacterium]